MSLVESNGWAIYFRRSANSKVGVVLVHDIFGFDDDAMKSTLDLAARGNWMAAVDMFHGKSATTVEEASKLRDSLSRDEILGALNSGYNLLKAQMPGGSKIGVMGFGMGGGLALLGASKMGFDFLIDYYGSNLEVEEAAGIRGPVLLILGGDDGVVTPWACQSFIPAAAKYGKRVEIHLYPNAGHSFHRPGWAGYNQEAAKDAWLKTLEFLSQFQ